MRIYEAFKPGVRFADEEYVQPPTRIFCVTKGEARQRARILNGGLNIRKGKTEVEVREHDLKGRPAFIDFCNRIMRSAIPELNGNRMTKLLPKGPEEVVPPVPETVPLNGKTKTVQRYIEKVGAHRPHKRTRQLWKEAVNMAEMELRWRKRNARRFVITKKEQGQLYFLRSIKRAGKIATEPGVMWTVRLIEARRFTKKDKAGEFITRFDKDRASNAALEVLRRNTRIESVASLTH